MTAASPELASADALLATLVQLSRRARDAQNLAALNFLVVNDTHALVPYRQAALWLEGRGVVALSGVVSVEANVPYVQWLQAWLAREWRSDAPVRVRDLSVAEQGVDDWQAWLPSQVMVVRLPPRARFAGGLLLLARENAFAAAECALLEEWADAAAAAYALAAANARRLRMPRGRVWVRWGVAAALVGAACLPVPLSVLAPAELVPRAPSVIRAPLDGVVERVLVVPNERVRAGQALFEFDRASLSSRLQVAQQSLATVQADYRQKAQRALFEPEAKAQLAVLQSQIEEKQVEVRYLRQLIERGVVVAPRDGVVLFDDPNQWVGRPVSTGERVMMVAQESEVVLEAWLAPADAIALPARAPVSVYLAADPVKPLAARVDFIAPEASLRPDGRYAYRLRAELAPESAAAARLGLRGTAKLQGESVSLAYWILRRPLGALRGWLGV